MSKVGGLEKERARTVERGGVQWKGKEQRRVEREGGKESEWNN